MSQIAQAMIGELQFEADSTRKYLQAIPEDKYDWKPHEKSMSFKRLAIHISEIPGWTKETMTLSELDFAKFDYKAPDFQSNADIVAAFDKGVKTAIEVLSNSKDSDFMDTWTMRDGDKVFFTMPKTIVMRNFVLNHLIHHRAQLGVYLRLNDIPLAKAYGPTADDQDFG